MKRGTKLVILILVILLTFLAIGVKRLGSRRGFKAELTGSEEVPPVKTSARGEISFHVGPGGKEMTYLLTVADIEGILGVHIHEGKEGENGSPVVDLLPPKKKAGLGDLMCEGTITAESLLGSLKGKSLDSLIELIRSRDAYVNIQSRKHPEGEIRGQIKYLSIKKIQASSPRQSMTLCERPPGSLSFPRSSNWPL